MGDFLMYRGRQIEFQIEYFHIKLVYFRQIEGIFHKILDFEELFWLTTHKLQIKLDFDVRMRI